VSDVDPALLDRVACLSLDAGNTIVFLDHARLASLLGARGIDVTVDMLVRAEGEAKRRAEDGSLSHASWSREHDAAARGWAMIMATILDVCGAPRANAGATLDALWTEHARLNLWSLVPADLPPALVDLRARGVKVAVVSNSEGMLEGLLGTLGILGCFDVVVDSGKVGVEKPDPRIFAIAMDACGATPERTLHLGDVFATDTRGARAAGIRTALIDPHGHLEGRHPEVPRVPGAAEVARALAARAKNEAC
jgi:HAD superfamily hydrolase (TIGR01509 family)